jgi:transposase-like protein
VPRPFRFSPDEAKEFRRQYEKGASLRQLAKENQCCTSTMKRALIAAGASIRKRNDPLLHLRRFTEQEEREFRRQYEEEGKTVALLAAKNNCSRTTMYNVLLRAGTTIRQRGGEHRRIPPSQAREFRRQYEQERKSIRELAAENDCGYGTMANALVAVGTTMRNRGERSRPRPRYTSEEAKEFRRQYEQTGMSVTGLAKAHGMTRVMMSKALKSVGTQIRHGQSAASTRNRDASPAPT